MSFSRGVFLLLFLSSVVTSAFAGTLAGSAAAGRALYPGHMMVGHLDTGRLASGSRHYSMGVAYAQYLWPKVSGVATVYYAIDANSDPNAVSKINTAISTFNADFSNVIQWVPWTSSDGPNYVDIDLSADDFSGQCEANEGYEAIPAQPMTGSTACAVGTILHEMGHVIGLWHEQSRPDAATYISENYGNVIKGSWSNFEQLSDDIQLLTPYDYASVMQYPPYSFSRNGGPVIESIPAGIPLGGSEGVPMPANADYSAADKEAIERLYGAFPTMVTVTSNPVGLEVSVDGQTITTPQQFNWALYSQHTLSVPSGVQTLTGNIENSTTSATFYYTYGRWNNSAGQTNTITVLPGNGSPAFPATSPQVATYSANFIELVPYTSAVYPDGSGSVSVSPSPQTYTGADGEFFVARQQATLTAAPTVGWNFYEFNNGPFWLPGGLGANPKTFFVPDTGNPVNTTAEFSNTPVFTVDVQPDAFSSNLYAYVDGGFWYTPKNFSAYYDTSWTFGSSHTLNVDSPEYPYSVNSRYSFSSWSDGGAQSHTIASLPGASTSYIATVTPEFAPATNFSYPPCGGSGTLTPSSPTNDGFYPTGQQLTYTATPDGGWTFAGWTYDLTGTTNPANLTASDETLVFANFNTTGAPLSLTSASPAAAYAGTAGFTLTLTGAGFTPDSLVSVNGQYRTVTFVSSTELQVQVNAADVASPTAFQIFVENFPSGWNGCAVFGYQTFIVKGQAQAITFPAVTGTLNALSSVSLTATASSGLPVSFASLTPLVCTVSGNTASLLIYGTCTITATQAGNGVYAPAPPASQSFHVNHLTQTITFPAIPSQSVDTQLSLSATASSGLAVSYVSTTTSVCTVSGSTASLVAAGTCAIEATQAGSGVYGVYSPAVAVTKSFKVNGLAQTITFPAVTGTLNALSSVNLTATATSGLAVSFASITPLVCTVSGNTASLLVYGTCTLEALQAGGGVYAAAPTVAQSFHVNHLTQTITFPAIPSQSVNTQLTLSATASSGLAVSYVSSTTSVCTVSGSTASLLTAGTCTIEATQAGSGVYGVYSPATAVKESFKVNGLAQTITFPTVTGTLNALSSVNLTATASSGLAVSFASLTPLVCTVSGNTASLLIYGTCTLEALQAGGGTYAAAPTVAQSFHVNHLTQTITFPAIPSQSVNTQLSLTATASSGLAVSFTSATTSVCTVLGSTASLVAAGTCTIEATQAGSGVYGVYSPAVAVKESFKVNGLAQTITFPAVTGTLNALSSVNLTATATSGLTVSFASLTPLVCTVSGNTASLLVYGTCTIVATQAGNGTFAAAPFAAQSFHVNHLTQTITFPAIPSQSVNSQLALSATASSGLAVSYTSSTTSVCTVSGSTASLLAAGTCRIEATQAGSGVYSGAIPVAQSFSVTQ